MLVSPVLVVFTFLCCCAFQTTSGQDCRSRQDLQGSLKQIQSLLSAHEASCLQSLRDLKKKINSLQSTAAKPTTKAVNSTCPKLEPPKNGRKLGKSQCVSHEVHFLCDPGYELVGPETRICQEGLTWSGQQPKCRDINECASSPCQNGGTCVDAVNQFSCICAKGWTGQTCQSPQTSFVSTTNTSSNVGSTSENLIRSSRCSTVQGTTHCTCEPGYTISGSDSRVCTDIDECTLFHNGQAGKLCLHGCVNTAGSYRCTCPAGYNMTRDGRSCKDIDECATKQNNCTKDQMCINTYGSFQCLSVTCPKIPNATYVRTSPMRCERNHCPLDNKACSQTPTSFTYHYMSMVSNLSAPRVVFRVSALRPIGDALSFSLLGGKQARRHFIVQRSDRLTGQLMLVSPIQGPATVEAEVEMSESEKGVQLGRYITKIIMFVSQYDF